MHRSFRKPLFFAFATLASGVAFAKDAVVPPLVARGVEPLVVLNMTSLVSSELEFTSTFENVEQLEKRPRGLTSSCLKSTSCLGNIARANSGASVLAGQVVNRGKSFDITLVYYDHDQHRIVRNKTFHLPNNPATIADSMGAHVREVITGRDEQAKAEQDSMGAFENTSSLSLLDDEEDDDLIAVPVTTSRRIVTQGNSRRTSTGDDDFPELEDFETPEDRAARIASERAAAEQARRQAQAEARRQAQEEARRFAEQQARERAQEQARLRAEADTRRRVEQEAQRAAANRRVSPNEFEDDETDEISFGSAVGLIRIEDDNAAAPEPYAPPSTTRRPSYSDDLDLDAPDTTTRRATNRQKPSRVTPKRTRSKTSIDRGSSDESRASLAARAGYSRYQALNFVTYGAELAYPVTPSVMIVGGIEAYSVRRQVDPRLLQEGQSPSQWNTILPLNLGALYKLTNNDFRPYVGGGMQFIPAYVKSAGGVAVGFRARAGFDYMVAEQFGLNLNFGAGMWSGKHFETVEADMAKSAMVPQVSMGTIFLF